MYLIKTALRITAFIVVCFGMNLFKPSGSYGLNEVREITYKNVNTVLTKQDIELTKGSYVFSGLTDTLPYTVTEDDIGINTLNISSEKNAKKVNVVVTDAFREVNQDGWTILEPHENSRKIYVSNSEGCDTNCGLTSETPVHSIRKARSLMRDGEGDWLLLKRGDEWSETLSITNIDGRTGNKEEIAPTVYTTYGKGQRPKVRRLSAHGGSDTANNVIVSGIYFPQGNLSSIYSDRLLIEDCFFYRTGINMQGNYSNIDFRRNVVFGNYPHTGTGHQQGSYTSGINGILFEENIYDHNGWHGGVEVPWNASLDEIEVALLKMPNIDDVEVAEDGENFLVHFPKPLVAIEEDSLDVDFDQLVTDGSPSFEIEQEFSPREDLAWQKPVSASSYRRSWVPEGANSNKASFWGGDSPSPQWWMVDLESEYTIDEIVVGWTSTTETSSAATDYLIEYSADGEDWNVAYEFKDGLVTINRTDRIEFDPITARYWRMYGKESPSGRFYMSGFEMYGPESEEKKSETVRLDLGNVSGGFYRFHIPGSHPTIFNHNFYIAANNKNIRVRRNIVTRASSHGIQLRPGGVTSENIFAKNPLTIWQNNRGQSDFTNEINRNVIIQGNDIGRYPVGTTRGGGIQEATAEGVTSGLEVHGNIIANNISAGSGGFAIQVRSGSDGGSVYRPHNISVKKNTIYEWNNSIDVRGNSETNTGVVVSHNIINNNRGRTMRLATEFDSESVSLFNNKYYADEYEMRVGGSSVPPKKWQETIEIDAKFEKPEFVDPHRNLATYNASLGGEESFEEFIEIAKQQSRRNWRWDYSPVKILEYFREGFTAITPPEDVNNLSAKTVEDADGEVLLEWQAPPKNNLNEDNKEGYYEVRYATYPVIETPAKWWNSISTDTGCYYSGAEMFDNPKSAGETEEGVVRGLYPGTTFYFGIRTHNAGGQVSWLDKKLDEGDPASAVSGNANPKPPSRLRVNYIGTNARLVWDKSTSSVLKNYIIHKSTVSEGSVKSTKTVCGAETEYDICLKEEGYFADYDKYYFMVKVVNIADSRSSHSNEVKLTPDLTPPVIEDRTARTRVIGRKEIKVSVTDDRQVYEVGGGYRSLGSDSEYYEKLEFPEPEEGTSYYEGYAEINDFFISTKGFEYYITASDAFNVSTTTWVQVTAPQDLPEQGFITPSNPELIFGSEVEEVLITDMRGNEVFKEKRDGLNNIVWNPSRGGSISMETGLYIYRIKTEEGYQYGSVVIAK